MPRRKPSSPNVIYQLAPSSTICLGTFAICTKSARLQMQLIQQITVGTNCSKKWQVYAVYFSQVIIIWYPSPKFEN